MPIRSDDGARSSVHRSGFASIVGRPNAGKSTLTNALVGEKVAITSSKPQTTRHAVRGIVTRPDAQLILVDTPGLHRPRTLLGERLNDVVRETLTEVDVVGFCLPSDQKIGPGDRFIAAELAAIRREGRGTPVVAIATKTDLVERSRLAEHLVAIQALADFDDIVPVSAVAGDQVDVVADLLIGHLPPGPPLYPEGELTDEPEAVMVAELVREAALEGVRDELPHSIAVLVEEVLTEDGLTKVYADIYVERASQKAIVIGAGGERLKKIGSAARRTIEKLLDRRAFLRLWVKVREGWSDDEAALQRFGYE
jgi:GTP-binding protein Era